MQTTGEQPEEVTVKEAVVLQLGTRQTLSGCLLGLDDEFQEDREQDSFEEKGWEELANASIVQTDLNYESPKVECAVESVLVEEGELRWGRVRRQRSRKSAAADLDGDVPEGAIRERTLLFQRELADILACIFAEARAAGRLDALVGQQVETAGGERD